MKDQNKTKKQLLNELMELRQRIAELETLENEHKGSGVVLEQLAAIVQSSDDAIISKTLEGIILSWNSGAERIYGYSSAEVIGRHISILLPPNRPDEVSQFLGRIGRGERIDHYETVHIRKDSQLILVSLTISPVRDATGKIVSASTIARDITERKRAEGEYRTILRTTMDGFWIADIQGRFLDVNDAYCRLIGYSRGELLTMSISDVEALERPEETAQRIQRIMETDGDRFETRHRCKDGRIIDIEVSVNYTEVGSRRLFVFLRDITERKRAEEALNTEKQRFQTLSEQAPFGMVMIEQNGTFRYINPKFKELFGYDLTDIPDGRTWFRKACPDPIYRHRVIAEWMKDLESFKRGEKRARIFKATCKDGTEKIVNFISVLLETGEYLMACEDITERKRAEEALKGSEQQLADIIEFLPDATLVIDREGKVIAWNHAMEAMVGVKAKDMLGKGNCEYAIPFYGERRPILIDLVTQPQEEIGKRYAHIEKRPGGVLMGESYIPNLKGGEFYFFGAAAPLYDQKGNLVGAIECIRDITERRNTDQRLESELRKFKVLYDLAVNISADKSLNENLAFIVEQSRNLLHADTSYIALADEQCQEVYMHTLSGIRTEAFKKMRLPFGRGLGGKVMTTRKGYIIEDYHQDGTITHIVDQVVIDEGLVSGMAVPIQIGEKSLGVLYVFNHTKTQFKQEDMNTLSLLGNLAAVEIAIHEAQQALRKSESTSKRLAQENAAMAEIGRIISSTLNIEEVYDRFAEEVKKLIPFDRIAIRTINPKDNTTTTAYILGVDVPGRQLGSTVPLFGTVIEKCIRTQSGLLFQPESMDEVVNRFPHLLPTFKAGLRSMMFVPLISKDQVIGVLSLQATKPKAHTEGDLRLAERVGNQIAGAITNAQLFTEVKKVEKEREKLILQLQDALAKVKTLRGLIPICSSCKKIRDDKGYWNQIEVYISDHSEADFSHGICPDCMEKLYPDLSEPDDDKKKQ